MCGAHGTIDLLAFVPVRCRWGSKECRAATVSLAPETGAAIFFGATKRFNHTIGEMARRHNAERTFYFYGLLLLVSSDDWRAANSSDGDEGEPAGLSSWRRRWWARRCASGSAFGAHLGGVLRWQNVRCCVGGAGAVPSAGCLYEEKYSSRGQEMKPAREAPVDLGVTGERGILTMHRAGKLSTYAHGFAGGRCALAVHAGPGAGASFHLVHAPVGGC